MTRARCTPAPDGLTLISDSPRSPGKRGQVVEKNAKLRAALAYLDDRLSTHPDSRFKPRNGFLLDEWLIMRRIGTRKSTRIVG